MKKVQNYNILRTKSVRLLIGLIAILIVMCAAVNRSVVALEHPNWLTGSITADFIDPSQAKYSGEPVPLDEQGCVYQSVYAGASTTATNVCVFQADGFYYGKIDHIVDGGQYKYFVIGLPGDDRMHYVENIPIENLVWLPNSKHVMYIGKGPGSQSSKGLYVIRNLVSQLRYSHLNQAVDAFMIHTDSIDPVLTDEHGSAVDVSTYGISEGGEYLAAKIAGDLLVRVSLRTFEKMLFRTSPLEYMWSARFTLSIDGETIIIPGGKSVARFIKLQENCGQIFNSYPTSWRYVDSGEIISSPCEERLIANLLEGVLGDELGWSSEPSFNYDGSEVTIMAHAVPQYNEPVNNKWIKLSLQGYIMSPRIQYLALGDSYSSGEGDIGLKSDGSSYYIQGTQQIAGCHLSERSYPYLLREMLLIDADRMKSVACSGAQMVMDYGSNPQTYMGQGGRMRDVTEAEVELSRKEALNNFKPGVVPQLEFIKKYKPARVTLTGGGNDVGFGDILKYCASPSWQGVFVDDTCKYAVEGSDLHKILYSSIDTQYLYTKSLIARMKQASPSTEVNLVGYPSFVASSSLVGCGANAGALDSDERKMINDGVVYMNSMLKRAAHDMKVNYIDIEDVLNGGRICEGAEYVTGISDIKISKLTNNDVQELFHPNHDGHIKIASAIHPHMSSASFTPAGEYEYKNTTVVEPRKFIVGPNAIKKTDSVVDVFFSELSFAPRSILTATSHSDVVNLGTFTAGDDGSVSASVDMSSVPIGQHVLQVKGVGITGKEKTYYQFIEVGESHSDADGDSVLDDEDPCMFITSWYDEVTGEDICKVKNVSEENNDKTKKNRSYRAVNNMIEKGKIGNASKLSILLPLHDINQDSFRWYVDETKYKQLHKTKKYYQNKSQEDTYEFKQY